MYNRRLYLPNKQKTTSSLWAWNSSNSFLHILVLFVQQHPPSVPIHSKISIFSLIHDILIGVKVTGWLPTVIMPREQTVFLPVSAAMILNMATRHHYLITHEGAFILYDSTHCFPLSPGFSIRSTTVMVETALNLSSWSQEVGAFLKGSSGLL